MWVSPRHPDYARLTGTQPTAAPPEPSGEVLAAFRRTIATGPTQELRVSLDEFENHPYISIRVWQKGEGGAWWPVKGKGVSVRLSEATGVAEALLHATELAPPPRERKPAGGKARTPQKGKLSRQQRTSDPPGPVPPARSGQPPWRPDPDSTGADWL